ncbi:MAG: M14 family zinc carboxypeptidase [bacterium]
MGFLKKSFVAFVIFLSIAGCCEPVLFSQITPPAEFVGFRIGQDRALFGWDKVVDYFKMLDSRSDRVSVQVLGTTTLGKPFLMATISSAMNLRNLAKYKNLQKQAANPRQLSPADAQLLAKRDKAVVLIVLNIQASEVASSQESIELAYRLANEESETVQSILENVIVLLVPSMNPDGLQREINWYNEYLDTPYEGSPMPYLNHPFAGEDNDKDWIAMNLRETRLLARQLYHEWFPHLVLAQHAKSSNGARAFLPPYGEPVNPNLHPLLVSEMNNFGQDLARELQAKQMTGMASGVFDASWWEGTTGQTPWWHNMMGLRAEIARVRTATSYYFPRGSVPNPREEVDQLRADVWLSKQWSGGWWRLRDVIDYELAIAFSLLDLIAQKKTSVVYNFCQMNQDAIARGQQEAPFAFVVPKKQHDAITADRMIEILLQAGVEVHRAQEDFVAGTRQIEKGAYVVLLAQPLRPYVKDILERQHYPDFDRFSDGSVTPPRCLTGWTLPLMMGVETLQLDQPIKTKLVKIDRIKPTADHPVRNIKANYVIRHTTNNSFILVNRLLRQRKKVYWLRDAEDLDGEHFEPGTIFIPRKKIAKHQLNVLKRSLSLEIVQTKADLSGRLAYRIRPYKLGLYQPWTANADEGWTRLLLEKFEFQNKILLNPKIRKGKLKGAFDVIILPDMTAGEIVHGRGQGRPPDIYSPVVPEQFRGGITEKGVANLKTFVQEGGTLITLNNACEFAIDAFGLPVENVVRGLKAEDFYCPGALLEILIDNHEPIAFGMPNKAAAMFVDSPAFRPKFWTHRTGVMAYYPEHNPLLSGLLVGGDKLQGRAAVLEVPLGKGRVVLIGFKAQHRAQTYGTFKLLFNAILYANAKVVVIRK